MATPAWSDAPALAASQHEPQWVRLCKLAIPAYRSCVACHGTGQVPHQKKRKVATAPPTPPPMVPCSACSGSGLMLRSPISDAERGDAVRSADANEVSGGAENGGRLLPHDSMVIESVDVAIIGGGIGGLALALALQQRGVRCAVYERDKSIGERSQGYGLTMQQGGTALRAIGLTQAVTTAGLHSTAHYSFDALSGALIGSHGAATRAAAPDAATRVDSALASGKPPIEAPRALDGTAAAAESACTGVASASGAPAAGSMAAQCKRAGSTAAHKQNVQLPRQSLRALLYALHAWAHHGAPLPHRFTFHASRCARSCTRACRRVRCAGASGSAGHVCVGKGRAAKRRWTWRLLMRETISMQSAMQSASRLWTRRLLMMRKRCVAWRRRA